jgi:hypothetical protein
VKEDVIPQKIHFDKTVIFLRETAVGTRNLLDWDLDRLAELQSKETHAKHTSGLLPRASYKS